MYACPFVRFARNNLAPTRRILMKFCIKKFFLENLSNNSSVVKIRQKGRVLYMKTFSHLWKYLAQFFFEWEIFWIKFVEKIKTHFMLNYFFLKSCLLWNNVEKCGGAGEAADNMAHFPARSHARTHKYTHTETCNTYCFSTATVVSWMCLSVTLYVHCLSCFVLCKTYHLLRFCNASINGTILTRENVSTGRKTCSSTPFFPQIPHGMG